MKNLSDANNEASWTDGNGTFRELIRQEYTGNNCVFSGGSVDGAPHPADTYYLRWSKNGAEPTMLLLRPDEVAAIAWLCTGLLWSEVREPYDHTTATEVK